MWSATKARYYYGLFLPSKDHADDDILVAVATFSNKRKIQIGSVKSRSVELLRFCTRANDTVVGGISKLTKSFINDHNQPDSTIDYLITVVDRDWGPGDGWHSIGFSTLHIMSPLLMLIKDGIRHHLVGAGISNKEDTKTQQVTRLGVEKHVLEELKSVTNHEEALKCLEESMYYPVYDAGVERLIMTVPKSPTRADLDTSYNSSIRSYGASYSSDNTGISSLLANVVSQCASSIFSGTASVPTVLGKTDVKDSLIGQNHINQWRKAPKDTTLLYETASSMDQQATVEVRHRLGGWCTIGIVGGKTKSIRHGNFKMNDQQEIDSSVLVSEYIRSMASMALTAMEFQKSHPDNDAITNNGVSCLHLGYGAGSLPRFMANVIPKSKHVVLEIDDGVVKATHECNLLGVFSSSKVELISGDALTYQRSNTEDPYDVVFIDIFDECNLLPSEFYTEQYIKTIQQNYLGGRSSGIVVHNFHTGGKKRRAILEEALKSYRGLFSTVFVVESLDSFPTGGNAILVAMNQRRFDASSETLSWHEAGQKANEYFELDFDIAARASHKLWLS